MRFRATLQLDGKTATGIRVPAEVMSSFGQSKRLAVRATINGYTYRSTVVLMGGEFKLPVSAEVREKAGIAANDEVEVDLEPDTEPREVIRAARPGGCSWRRCRRPPRLRWVVRQQQEANHPLYRDSQNG